MYCKKCGKKIPDTARFCDRCGQPVKSGSGNGQNRENRRKQMNERKKDSYESYRKRKMQRETERKRLEKKRKMITTWLIILAFVLSIGLGFYAYYATMNGAKQENNASASPTAAATQKSSESPEDESEENSGESIIEDEESSETPEPENDDSDDDSDLEEAIGKYDTYESANDFECIYPAAFEDGDISNNDTVKSLKDPNAEDTIMLISYEEVGKSVTAGSILSDFKDNNSVSNDEGEPEMLTEGNSYSITYIRNGQKRHRCGVILDNTKHVYYDFNHDNMSEYSNEYAEYINDIDEYLKKQTKKNSD